MKITEIIKDAYPCNIVVSGGDTLFQIMQLIDCSFLYPQCEISPGVVVSVLIAKNDKSYLLIRKAGSFGKEDIIAEIDSFLINFLKKGASTHEV